MIPIIVDPVVTSLALIGRGKVAERRLALLDEGGAAKLTVFSDQPSLDLEEVSGQRLKHYLPEASELSTFAVVWIADLPLDLAVPLAEDVRKTGGLVNVEDVEPWCDFHNPAQVRRGDLLLTVSTNGQSPGLAVRIKQKLGSAFGPEWAERLGKIGRKRDAWKRRKRSLSELASLTDVVIDTNGWLDHPDLADNRKASGGGL